jgi:putative DNA primase/helicase
MRFASRPKVRIVKGEVERIPVPLSKDIAQLYLHGLEGSWGLKPFRGIVTAPILSNDGTIRTASGYDARTGLWCHDIPDVAVPTKPTRNDAERALRKLRGLFRTFPFADATRLCDPDLSVEVVDPTKGAGLDESSFLAALLTAVCRQSLELAPGFLCDAPNLSGAGTGKGLLVKAMCVVASGVRPSAFTSGHDAEEFDKRLTSALTEARPAVFLDNFNSKSLTSDILASTLTESPAMVRPMGQTKTVPLHTRTFIGITGNAVQIAEDMARRLLNTHLDARMENPEQRPFQPGFLDHIFAERAHLLAAALTIWRWGRQTQPKSGKPLGSYEVWAQWCRDPLLALGMRDPVDRIAEIKAADPKRRALIAVFEQWWTSHRDLLLKGQDLDHEVVSLIPGTITRDGVISRQKVARFLVAHDGTRAGGYVLSSTPRGPPSKEVAHYKLAYEPEEPAP